MGGCDRGGARFLVGPPKPDVSTKFMASHRTKLSQKFISKKRDTSEYRLAYKYSLFCTQNTVGSK